jgi:cellulose biosynthesis protein BcsQ
VRALAVASIKGGVGKTSTVVNLAGAASERGATVLVWDLDPQGSATWALGVVGRVPEGARAVIASTTVTEHVVHRSSVPAIDVIPADYSLRHVDAELAATNSKNPIRKVVRKVRDRYDLVLIDCSPGITPTVDRALHAVDGLLIPVVPSTLPMRSVGQLRAYVAADRAIRRLPVLPFLSMIDRRRATHRRLVDELTAEDPAFLATPIPLSVDIESVGTRRRPVTDSRPASKAADAYRAAWQEIQDRVPDGSD